MAKGDNEENDDDVPQALESYFRCLKINPYCFVVIRKIIEVYFFQKQWKRVMPYSQKYIELNPYDPTVYEWMGQAQIHEDLLEEAKISYNKVLEINSLASNPLAKLGDISHL